ncbi:MAG TPA: MBL fold metallo-hydrolase, partial [Burkholderiaceae bacterium]|nr:MBL fold metallo-hydrolase [Burkholderiaceae bacterium]
MQMLPAFVQPVAQGLYAIDTGFHRPNFDAAYLIVDEGRAAFVDTGTNHSVPRLLAALQALGLTRDAVDYVIPTHVHLDHAGGAGLLMSELPRATLVVHPQGAPHLIDPHFLIRSATGVYGPEEIARSYGTVIGVPATRVQRSSDGMALTLGRRRLTFLDTPGHARHHHCIWDERTRGFFTGDTFGLSYREFDTAAAGPWLMPTTTPVQFDPEALRVSVARLLDYAPDAMYLTHYGRVGHVRRLGTLFFEQLDAMVELALSRGSAPPADAARHRSLVDGLAAIHLRSLRLHGCTLPDERIRELLALDL